MPLRFETDTGPMNVNLSRLVVAGWTGRDRSAVEHHIRELASIGVPPPSRTPLFYEVSPDLATQADEIAVLGNETSGEAEPLLIRFGGALWLGLASDHTDRGLEAHSVAHSKQICAKPFCRRLWPFASVQGRLDELTLRCWITDDGRRTLYQEGTLAAILPLDQLLAETPLDDGEAMLCGTLPAIGGIKPANSYEMELRDGASSLSLGYRLRTIAVAR